MADELQVLLRKKVEECFNLLTLTDGTEIPLDSISDIFSEIFNDLEL